MILGLISFVVMMLEFSPLGGDLHTSVLSMSCCVHGCECVLSTGSVRWSLAASLPPSLPRFRHGWLACEVWRCAHPSDVRAPPTAFGHAALTLAVCQCSTTFIIFEYVHTVIFMMAIMLVCLCFYLIHFEHTAQLALME